MASPERRRWPGWSPAWRPRSAASGSLGLANHSIDAKLACNARVGSPMKFEPLYYSDRLHLVNPSGDVGVVTLWSQVKQVRALLEGLEIDLSPETSRIAVIANLYGNGFPHMLRN